MFYNLVRNVILCKSYIHLGAGFNNIVLVYLFTSNTLGLYRLIFQVLNYCNITNEILFVPINIRIKAVPMRYIIF